MPDLSFIALTVLLGLSVLSQGTLWIILYQVVKQHGRILLRLDELDRRLAQPSPTSVLLPLASVGSQTREPEQSGLRVGTRFPSFRLHDLAGNQVSLDNLLGQQVLLVHWSPDCGFCDVIAPDLANLQADFQKRDVALVLVAHGESESNRLLAEKHGLDCTILLLARSQRLEGFERMGTPVAYLLDVGGHIAASVAIGYEQVLALARETATVSFAGGKRLPGQRPLSESRIERTGIKPGTLAPVFTLPDVFGRTVSLEGYRGRRVLLIFSDPHCGPCDELARHLVHLHQGTRNKRLDVVMVSRGDIDENRLKAEQHGFDSPMVVQKQWELSRAYGIFATPVAFLVNEDGMIAEEVAMGVDNVLMLAGSGKQAHGRTLR
jgi:peroxiredoxin